PWVSSFNLLAIDSNWVAGYGGFSNRYATNMYTGIGADSYTQTVGAKDTADVAIYLAYKITNLAPGITHTFKFATIFDTASVAAAISALNLSTVSTHDLGSLENSVKVYPNPFTDNTTISIGNAVVLSNAEIHVYDVVGKEVKIISNIQSHQFIMDRSGLSNGMYFYKLINKGQVIGSGKLVIK
ncbi:MAG: T9SS type A sorting domain-containing protein, partial [Bacteroidia bacterium]